MAHHGERRHHEERTAGPDTGKGALQLPPDTGSNRKATENDARKDRAGEDTTPRPGQRFHTKEPPTGSNEGP
jgi:hypothetical protein